MIYQIRALGFALLAPIVALMFSACGDIEINVDVNDAVRGSGTPINKSFDLRDFMTVELSSTFDVEITQAETFAVSVTVDDNLLDRVLAEVRGDTLVLGLTPGHSVRRATLEASIAMPTIKRIKLTGASRATVGVFKPMPSFEAEASGTSAVTGEIVADHLDVRLSGASRIDVSGSAAEAMLQAAGTSRLELDALEITTGSVWLSGASSGDVYVTGRLARADASGASYLTYRGDPELGGITTSGGSRIVPAR
jgi:hypothetical protein